MSASYNRNHNVLDGDISRRSLNLSHRTLVNNINTHDLNMILSEIERTKFLTEAQIRDIKDLHVLSLQSRILLSKISRTGVNGYKKFTSILFHLEQFNLLQTLTDNEDTLVTERNHQKKLKVDYELNSTACNSQQTIDTECKICMQATLSVAIIPCGHTLCYNCGEIILKDHICCFCKHRISYLQNLYFLTFFSIPNWFSSLK